MKRTPERLALALGISLALHAVPATAHDTWFDRVPALVTAPASEPTLLKLGTGNQFPAHETGIAAQFLAAQGCTPAGAEPGRTRTARRPPAMQALRNEAAALLLRAPPKATTCWAQLQPFDVELAPDKVSVYLKDIQATPDIRATWAAMQARGLPWRERYTKHARIELGPPSAAPTPMGLDLRIENAGSSVRVGTNLSVQVLRDGQPLPGLAVELRSESSPLGIWRRSDAQGRIEVTAPLPGRWLLRGVDLRLSASDPDRWDSRFVTLAFDVAPN